MDATAIFFLTVLVQAALTLIVLGIGVLILAVLLICQTSSSPQGHPAENIRIVGLEARQDMDQVCNDFLLWQVQHMLHSRESGSYGFKEDVTQ